MVVDVHIKKIWKTIHWSVKSYVDISGFSWQLFTTIILFDNFIIVKDVK